MQVPKKLALAAAGLSALMAVGVAGAAVSREPERERPTTEAPVRAPDRARHPRLLAGLAAIREVSGLDRGVFLEGARDGLSINAVLMANGLDPETMEAAALGIIDAQLDALVAEGRITQEQTDALYTRAADQLSDLMEREPPGRPHPLGALLRDVVRQIAEILGIDLRDLLAALHEGQAPAALAEEHGIEPAQLIAQIENSAFRQIDEALAQGKLTQEQADHAKRRVSAAIEKFVYEGPGANRPHRRAP